MLINPSAPFYIFGTIRLFKNFSKKNDENFDVSKGSSFNVFEILKQSGFSKNQRASFQQFLALWDFSEGLLFVLKFGLLSEPTRHIRIRFS